MLLGIVGKTNVGKTTFFSAATLVDAERGNRPFVTINPNEGIGYVRVRSACSEFGLRCQPKSGWCNGRNRYVPVRLLDVAGLVRGAHAGRGLGNKFLDDLRRADVNLLVVDASGGTDSDGNPVRPGSHDPIEDVDLVKEEFAHWIAEILKRNMNKVLRRIQSGRKASEVLAEVLSGLAVERQEVEAAASGSGVKLENLGSWGDRELLSFSSSLRRLAKPFVIVANKVDVPEAEENVARMREVEEEPVVPASAESEYILRKAAEKGYIRYEPGDGDFEILNEDGMSRDQIRALELVRERVLKRFGSTGVQEALEKAVFEVGGFLAVFPVEDENRLSDKDGRILPDVLLLPRGSTVLDLAAAVHTELADRAIGGVDVRKKIRISLDRPLNHRDIVKVVVRRR